MARIILSLILASAVADDQRLRGAQTAGSFSMEHRSGGRHASFGGIVPSFYDVPLITCDGNPGKCIGPDGAVEDFGEMQCNTVSAPFLVADPTATQEKLKCGPHDGPNDRTFKFTTDDVILPRNGAIYFNVDACKAACAGESNCEAMSLGIGGNYWCMGCSKELDKEEVQTVAAYKKAPYFCGGQAVSQEAVEAGSECEWTFCPALTMKLDESKEDMKCGDVGDLLRSFKFSDKPDCTSGKDPQCVTDVDIATSEEKCKAACLNDETCVAVSRGVVPDTGYEYCIGCQVPLWFDFDGATAYEKVQETD